MGLLCFNAINKSASDVGQNVRRLSHDLMTSRGSGLAPNLRMSGPHIPVKSYNTATTRKQEKTP